MIDKNTEKMFREIRELLETAAFSLETTLMALNIGTMAKNPRVTLAQRLKSLDQESTEAAQVGVEALEHALSAYLELESVFDDKDGEAFSLDLRFWSTIEWINERIFGPSALQTGQEALAAEIREAILRTQNLMARLDACKGVYGLH